MNAKEFGPDFPFDPELPPTSAPQIIVALSKEIVGLRSELVAERALADRLAKALKNTAVYTSHFDVLNDHAAARSGGEQ